MQKHKFASISLTVQDRAISSKFSIHRVSQQSTLANFVQVLEQNSCFPLGGHYACQCILFLVVGCYFSAIYYVHPLGGVNILFLLFLPPGVRRPTWFPDILGNSSYPIFTKFGMQVYWVNSLYGIAFGDDSSIAN